MVEGDNLPQNAKTISTQVYSPYSSGGKPWHKLGSAI